MYNNYYNDIIYYYHVIILIIFIIIIIVVVVVVIIKLLLSYNITIVDGNQMITPSIGMQVVRMGCVPACGGNGNSRNVSCSKPSLLCRQRLWEGALYKW